VTAPPECFGAHYYCPLLAPNFQQIRDSQLELFAFHVVRISSERRVFPGGVAGNRGSAAPPAEFRTMLVSDINCFKVAGKLPFVEVWISARTRERANIDKNAYAMSNEKLLELIS
jgi:hypothetical protein